MPITGIFCPTGKNIAAETIDASGDSGGIYLEEADVSIEIRTATTAGTIHVELVDSAGNYMIKSCTVCGSNNLSDKEFYGDNSGSKMNTASTTAGNIHYEFAEDN